MTSRDFAYWLQGLFEIGKPTELNAEQTDLIKRHLAMVFVHEIDPSAGSAAHQAELNAVHSSPSAESKPSPFPPQRTDGVLYRC